MQNLTLVKYTIDKLDVLINLQTIIDYLKPHYNLSLVLIQRDLAAPIRNVPIFNMQELPEFHDMALALDVLAAKELEKLDFTKPLFFNMDKKLGLTKIPKIDSIESLISNKE